MFINKSYFLKDFDSGNNFRYDNYFINIPISLKTKIYKKISLNIGLANNIFVKSSYDFGEYAMNYNLGVTTGLSYNISDRIELSADFQTDLTAHICYGLFLNAYQYSYLYGSMISINYKLF
jgi:hypothetical protein